MRPQCSVYLGDCRQLLPLARLENTLIDSMIVDPPYSDHTHNTAVSCAANSPGGKGAHSRELGFDPLDESLRAYLAGCASRVRRWTIAYTDDRGMGGLAASLAAGGAEWVRTLQWIRWSMPQLTCDRPPQGFETLLLFHRQRIGARGGIKPLAKSWNGPGWTTHLEHKCMRGGGKHPAEKPLDQALDLVHWFTEPGERIYDPTAGSGTVGLAAAMLGRGYVGIEIQPDWATFADARIRNWVERRELSERDSTRFDRWRLTLAARESKIVRIAKPGDRQHQRCLAAMRRDLGLAQT